MNNLISDNKITSLQLLEKINDFREKEGNRKLLLHKSLLSIIRDEFEQEIHEQNILPMYETIKIANGATRKSLYYILTLPQAKQVLVRESKFVRRAVIQYIEKLENYIKNPQQMQIQLPKPYELIKKYYNNELFMDIEDLAHIFGFNKCMMYYYIKKYNVYGIHLINDELVKFKRENPNFKKHINSLLIYDRDDAIDLTKYLNRLDKQQEIIAYFESEKISYKDSEYIPTETQLRQAEILCKLTEDMDINFKTFFREYASYLVLGSSAYKQYTFACDISKLKNELRSMDKEDIKEAISLSKQTNSYKKLTEKAKIYIDKMYNDVLIN